MIELKSIETISRAIERAKAESKNLLVQTTDKPRQYLVTNRSNGRIYTVNFYVMTGTRLASCNCKAGERNIPCKHIASSAALNMWRAASGQLKSAVV